MAEEPIEDSGAFDVVAKRTEKRTPRAVAPLPRPAEPLQSNPDPGTATKAKPTLAYQSAKSAALAKSDPEILKNQTIPLWLLAVGVAVEIIAAFIREAHDVRAALLRVAIELFLGTIIMLVGILAAAKLRHIDLGSFWIAVFKLAAISVAPAALVAIFTPFLNYIPFGGIIGWIGQFIFYFALLGVLFDLDESDTWYCVAVIFVVRVAAYFFLAWAINKWG